MFEIIHREIKLGEMLVGTDLIVLGVETLVKGEWVMVPEKSLVMNKPVALAVMADPNPGAKFRFPEKESKKCVGCGKISPLSSVDTFKGACPECNSTELITLPCNIIQEEGPPGNMIVKRNGISIGRVNRFNNGFDGNGYPLPME